VGTAYDDWFPFGLVLLYELLNGEGFCVAAVDVVGAVAELQGRVGFVVSFLAPLVELDGGGGTLR
jgi:hypothetical protein